MNLPTEQNKTMSSREIATLTGKEHKHVFRDLKKMLIELVNFTSMEGYVQSWTHPQNHQEYQEFVINQELTTCLLTGYDARARMAVIRRWAELEKSQTLWIQQLSPQAHIALEDMSKQIECLADKIQVDAPKVEFVDKFVSVGESKTFREVAAILGVRSGYLMSCLKARKIVYKNHKDNEYKAYSEFAKYFETKVGIANEKEYNQLRVNCEGVIYLSRRFGSNENKVVAI